MKFTYEQPAEIAQIEREVEVTLALGREVEEDPTRSGFFRQGRPLTNIEMNAHSRFTHSELRRKANEILGDL